MINQPHLRLTMFDYKEPNLGTILEKTKPKLSSGKPSALLQLYEPLR